jgi:TolA-binding protein
MNKATLLTLPFLVATLITPALSRGEDFLLYAPKPASGEQAPTSPDQGVMVRSVIVKRGDTLKNLSRKYIGVASWFPQVLLFNTIKNPDLIHPGDKLLVPVPPAKAAAVKSAAEKAAPVKKHARGEKRHSARHKAVRHKGAAQAEKPQLRAATPDEQGSYQQAKRAYLNGDYQKSLDLFTAFLRKYPRSAYSADAALYRADCYLRLAGE